MYKSPPNINKEGNAIIAFLGGGLISGVGYATAKKIVGHFGADIVHCLKESSEINGDTYLPLPDLCMSVCQYFQL